jgi:hypothetical protein
MFSLLFNLYFTFITLKLPVPNLNKINFDFYYWNFFSFVINLDYFFLIIKFVHLFVKFVLLKTHYHLQKNCIFFINFILKNT